MTEFDFIRQYLKTRQGAEVVLGIGDDAAVIRPRCGFDLCFSSDMLVGGRHFFIDESPEDLAWKVLAVNVSDMAAMGAEPKWVLLSVALPYLDKHWLERFCCRFFELSEKFGVVLIGGDTTKGEWVFNITIAGELPEGKALKRSAAMVGDDIWVSGQLGSAAAGLRVKQNLCVLPENLSAVCIDKLLRPEPRVALGRLILPFANAAQDVSDGLAQDLGHILTASGVGAEIFVEALPSVSGLREELGYENWLSCVLSGGDDYELVFTAPHTCRRRVEEAAEHSGVAVTRIGTINDTGRLNIKEKDGSELKLTSLGFDHFG